MSKNNNSVVSTGHWLAKGWVRALLFYGVAVMLLATLLWRYDFSQVLAQIGRIDFIVLLGVTLLLVLVTLLGAWNTYLFIGRDGNLTFRQFLPMFWSSWAFGLLIPGQVGDIASLGWLLRKYGLPVSISLGRATLDKIISAVIMTAISAIGLALVFADKDHVLSMAVIVSSVAVGTILAAIAATAQSRRIAWYARHSSWFDAVLRTVNELGATWRSSPARVVLNAILTFLKILLTGLVYWVVIHALGATNLEVLDVVVVATTAGLVAYIPVSVNGLGTVELSALVLFGQLGVPETVVLAAYVLLRSVVLVVAWVPLPFWLLAVRMTDDRR